MVIVLKQNPDGNKVEQLMKRLRGMGLDIHQSQGKSSTILGLVGDTSSVDIDALNALEIVETVKRIQEPYKSANRKFHPEDSVIEVGGAKIGGGNFAVIAGPCSVESRDQLCCVAADVKAAGATYAFQGLRGEGIRLLLEAKKETGLPIVTEIMDLSQLYLFDEVDVIQVGARNMQNFEMLKELGHLHKPILLKRGLSSTLQELLMSAEYIMAGGNQQVILCERGIRTFETVTRNTLDLSAVPALRAMTHLPIIVDPSHATGHASMVKPMAIAAAAAGADGLMIEVHNDPANALCDGQQSLTPAQFADTMQAVQAVLPFACR